MAIVQRIRLNLIPNNRPIIVPVNQNDTGNDRLVFELDMLVDGNVSIQGTCPDGSTFTHSVSISSGLIKSDLFMDMTGVCGDVYAQLVFDDGINRTGSQAFILRVQKEAKE